MNPRWKQYDTMTGKIEMDPENFIMLKGKIPTEDEIAFNLDLEKVEEEKRDREYREEIGGEDI